jgi:hypothetical protein
VANEALAVIDQQPQIKLRSVQLRGWEGIQPFLQRGAGNIERVDRVGLAALTGALARLRGQMRRDAQHPLAALDQEALERAGHVPAILKRPTRSPSSVRAHCNRAAKPRRPTATVCSPSSSPVTAATAAIVCERL